MFMDTTGPGAPGGEPWMPSCPSCKSLIAPGEKVEDIRFDANDPHNLAEMNGTYHVECARPILSVKRAYDMLKRSFG